MRRAVRRRRATWRHAFGREPCKAERCVDGHKRRYPNPPARALGQHGAPGLTGLIGGIRLSLWRLIVRASLRLGRYHTIPAANS
jgi:hypothetical protein